MNLKIVYTGFSSTVELSAQNSKATAAGGRAEEEVLQASLPAGPAEQSFLGRVRFPLGVSVWSPRTNSQAMSFLTSSADGPPPSERPAFPKAACPQEKPLVCQVRAQAILVVSGLQPATEGPARGGSCEAGRRLDTCSRCSGTTTGLQTPCFWEGSCFLSVQEPKGPVGSQENMHGSGRMAWLPDLWAAPGTPISLSA